VSHQKFVLPDGTKTADPIELVVIDFVSRNEFYEGAYDKDNITPPGCFAIHPEPKMLVPSANSPNKQCDDCNSCPNNQFGSAGAGKACKNTRLLAVLPPDATEDTPLWLLKVSPTALKSFDGFVAGVARTFQMPPMAVVVTVGFNDAEDYPNLTFTDPRPNENLEACFARQDEAKDMLTREPDVSNYAAPAKKVSKPAAKPAGRPTVARR
jgi:hypothetical protein